MKIALISVHNLHLMQFLYSYTEVLDEQGIQYDVLYWDRDVNSKITSMKFSGRPIAFKHKMSNYQSKVHKVWGFYKCLSFFIRKINIEKYDKIVLLTTQTALPLYVMSSRVRRSSYAFDYRDTTYEKISILRLLIKRIISNSKFTAISSLGYLNVLGNSEKFVLAHNCRKLSSNPVKQTESRAIRIVFWGMIRQVEYNKKLIDAFAMDPRFELFYHGEGSGNQLREYCEANGYKSVHFSGRFGHSEIENFAKQTDILLNAYDNDFQQTHANTVKLYDGFKFDLPMFISKGSHMAAAMRDNVSVYSFRANDVNTDEIYEWFNSIKHISNRYEKEIMKVNTDNAIFKKTLVKFINKD